MKKIIYCFSIAIFSITSLYAATGTLDMVPLYYMADSTTPIVVHFTHTDPSYTVSYVSCRYQLSIPGTSNYSNFYSWSTISTPGWRTVTSPLATLQAIPVTGTTAAGILVGRSTSLNNYGISSVYILQKIASIINFSTNTVTITGLDPTSGTGNGGWVEGTLTDGASGVLVLVKDVSNNILGAYISENNQVSEEYPNTPGYFKIAVPAGTQDLHVSFLKDDLSTHMPDLNLGTVSVTAGSVTNIGAVPVKVSDFKIE